ncbi:unnamed protein product [Amoebophrya sp. A120]|nr:unnamed protein product [Amoebophrya sp. A120]|eukprot:GSA120T00018873001.1
MREEHRGRAGRPRVWRPDRLRLPAADGPQCRDCRRPGGPGSLLRRQPAAVVLPGSPEGGGASEREKRPHSRPVLGLQRGVRCGAASKAPSANPGGPGRGRWLRENGVRSRTRRARVWWRSEGGGGGNRPHMTCSAILVGMRTFFARDEVLEGSQFIEESYSNTNSYFDLLFDFTSTHSLGLRPIILILLMVE